MFKRIYILLTLILLLSVTGVAYAAPPVQESSQQSLVEVAREAGNFTTLIQALEAANLTDTLENEGPFTIFAPTDEAFAALPTNTFEGLFADPEALRNVLSYHVVEGNLTAADLATMDTVSTLQGATANVTINGETVMVGGAQVLNADIQAANGVIHAIDTVLMPPSAMMDTESEMTESDAMTEPSTQQDSPIMAPGAGACSEDYVVQADDSLSQIANKFFGNPRAFSIIVEATNAAAADNQSYANIDDPNLIVVGQTLCIPGSTETQSSPSVTEMAPTSGSEATSTSGDETMAAEDEMMMTVPEGQSVVIFENLSSFDLVFDLSGPTPDSLVVPPGAKQTFILEPGQYRYDGHQPGGGFDVAPGQFQLTAQQPVQVTCYDSPQCQVQSLNGPQMETE